MKKFLCLLLCSSALLLSACSYDSTKAVKNGDVINMNGPVYNFFEFEQFLESVEHKKKDTVRITNYTLEGDPTFYDLSFNGSSIEIDIDRTKNKNRGNSPAKINMICENLVEEDGQQLFTYSLESCDAMESFTVLSVSKEQEHDHEH